MRVRYKGLKDEFIGTIIKVKTITKSTIAIHTEGKSFEKYIKLIGNTSIIQNISIEYTIKWDGHQGTYVYQKESLELINEHPLSCNSIW